MSSTPTISRAAGRRGDRLFHGLSRGAGLLTFALLVAVGVFLVVEAVPALRANTASFLTTTEWSPDSDPVVFGIAALAFGTIVSSVIALIIAVPVAVGAALFIAFYAPRRVAAPFAYMVDLLAAVPSVVYGLWGLYALMPPMIELSRWLDDWFGWIPLFHSVTGTYGR
jgi:phosphate transport system permease protein